MKSHTEYMTFKHRERREFVRITEDVQGAVDESGVAEGMVLVSAMHITAGVWVNDDEPGSTPTRWSGSTSWRRRAGRSPRTTSPASCCPTGGDYRHHRGGEDNGDAHLKNLLVHQQVVLPITEGAWTWGRGRRSSTREFDGRRAKRLVIKVIGD